MKNKAEQLLMLAKKRQQTHWDGYHNIGDYHNGVYECDFVSPYTKSANNVDAEVMVILQDWSSDESLSGAINSDSIELGYTRWRSTNRTLIRLLDNHFRLKLSQIYATNLFPFIKPGARNSRIRFRDMVRAASEFALPQIQIIQPKIVICLGLQTFNALRVTCGEPKAHILEDGVNSPFSQGMTRIWCQAHTGNQGQNNRNRGGINRVASDWDSMAHDLQR